MNRFLLIENKAFFNRHGVHTVSPYKAKFTVPHRNAIIFFGDHHRELRVKTNKLGQAYLRDVLKLSDGNLSVQIRKLEEAGYIKVEKVFIDRKPKTFCKITSKGQKAVRKLIRKLEDLVNLD